MELKNLLFVTSDMDKSVEFYKNVLGLQVAADFGANKILTGGLCLQTLETYTGFIGTENIVFGGNDSEVYFEEYDFDGFVERLKRFDINYVHGVKEHSWGQRAVRFYDPDRHIVEVGESMKAVCGRFLDGGMTPEQTAKRMDVPLEYIKSLM
ncbi:MAG: VOC family protein [Clostridia bacterium]|nr:VOC family protein [Clostridia bacterium]